MYHVRGSLKVATDGVRDAFRDRQLRWVTIGIALLVVAVPLAEYLFLGRLGVHQYPWLEGFLAGFLLAAFLSIALYIVLVGTGSDKYFVGGLFEQATANLLKNWGENWVTLHNIPMVTYSDGRERRFDVDHVAVGPHGVVVVETKFRSGPVNLSRLQRAQDIRRSATQVAKNADDIRHLLQDVVRSHHVTPLLVYWGRQVTSPPRGFALLEGTYIVAGGDHDAWKHVFGNQRLSLEERRAIVARLSEITTGGSPVRVRGDGTGPASK